MPVDDPNYLNQKSNWLPDNRKPTAATFATPFEAKAGSLDDYYMWRYGSPGGAAWPTNPNADNVGSAEPWRERQQSKAKYGGRRHRKQERKKARVEARKEKRRQRNRQKRINRRINKPWNQGNFGFNNAWADDMFRMGPKFLSHPHAGKIAIGGALAITAASAFAMKGLSSGMKDPLAFGGRLSPEEAANSSFWQRQNAVMAAGYMSTDSSVGGALWKYNTARVADIANVMTSGSAPTGAVVGGGMGLVSATALQGFSKKGLKGRAGAAAAIGGTLFGATLGAYTGAKVDIGLSRAIQTARKNILGQGRRLSKRAHTTGPGFRSWASPKGRRRMGQPGHLGMDGSMAFAMHNARNRTTL